MKKHYTGMRMCVQHLPVWFSSGGGNEVECEFGGAKYRVNSFSIIYHTIVLDREKLGFCLGKMQWYPRLICGQHGG